MRSIHPTVLLLIMMITSTIFAGPCSTWVATSSQTQLLYHRVNSHTINISKHHTTYGERRVTRQRAMFSMLQAEPATYMIWQTQINLMEFYTSTVSTATHTMFRVCDVNDDGINDYVVVLCNSTTILIGTIDAKSGNVLYLEDITDLIQIHNVSYVFDSLAVYREKTVYLAISWVDDDYNPHLNMVELDYTFYPALILTVETWKTYDLAMKFQTVNGYDIVFINGSTIVYFDPLTNKTWKYSELLGETYEDLLVFSGRILAIYNSSYYHNWRIRSLNTTGGDPKEYALTDVPPSNGVWFVPYSNNRFIIVSHNKSYTEFLFASIAGDSLSVSKGNSIDTLDYWSDAGRLGLGIIADVNNDGYREIIGQKNGKLTVFDGHTGNVLYSANIELNYSEYSTFSTLIIGDTDSSGYQEVYVAYDYDIYLMEFSSTTANIILELPYGEDIAVFNGDLDNDGWSEITTGYYDPLTYRFYLLSYWGRWDADYPIVEWFSPPNGTITNNVTLYVKVSAYDNTSGIGEAYVYLWEEYPMEYVGNNTYQARVPVSYNGSMSLEIYVYDSVGHGVYILLDIMVDMEPPSIEIYYPDDGDILNTSSITVTWGGFDLYSGIEEYRIKIDDGDWISVGLSTNYSLSLADGWHTISVQAVDLAGNARVDSIEVLIDTELPSLRILEPKNNTKTTNRTIVVRWEGSDSISGIDHYEVKLDDGFWSETHSTQYTLENVDDGKHIIYIKAVDRAGNYVVKCIIVEVYTAIINLTPVIIVATVAVALYIIIKRRKRS